MKIAHQISAANRKAKFRRFMTEMKPDENTQILDVGISDKEYSPNDNFIEKNYPWPHRITALGIDQPIQFCKRYPCVKVVQYDGRVFPFGNRTFDICHSNAVIEHVGTREDQVNFLKELVRVGKKVWLTTPNRGFPIEVHTRIPFAHWLKKSYFDVIARALGKGFATGNYMNLLYREDIKALLKMAQISNYRIIANRKFGLVMDFVVVISDEK